MRTYSILFHLLLTLFLLAISSLAWMSGDHNLQLGMLPWRGAALTHWLFFSALAGLLVTVLASRRVLPFLFLAWSVAVFVMLVKGFFFSSYGFGLGGGNIRTALYWVLAALVAVIGAWFQFRPVAARMRRKSVLA